MSPQQRFPIHGWLGVLLVAAGEVTVFAGIHPYDMWTTPLCWWGYVLLLDAVLKRLAGESPICDRPRVFFLLWLPLSVLFWIGFEVVNLHLENWYYVNLPREPLELTLGAAISFATILPGMFLTAELLRTLGVFRKFRLPPIRVTGWGAVTSCLAGFALLIVPLLLPREEARYTFALVWMGFFFLLEPVNHASGVPSILSDLTRGRLERFICLMAAGVVCGLLWEFWNFWSASKWVYSAPFTQDLKYFEMPVAGFLGFLPFALEYFALYNFARIFGSRGGEEPSEAIGW
ncbi:MAG: hypothetical protein ACYS99_13855 [Planctomycetota bacterium]|jgi:hypothetical protein